MKSLGNILAGMVVGMLVVVSGCNATGNAFARSLVSTAAHQAVVSGVQNEIEGPRGTTVNVVQGQGSKSRTSLFIGGHSEICNCTRGGREEFMKRFDSDGNGEISESEREAIREHFRNGGGRPN